MRIPKELSQKISTHYYKKSQVVRDEFDTLERKESLKALETIRKSEEWKNLVAAAKAFDKSLAETGWGINVQMDHLVEGNLDGNGARYGYPAIRAGQNESKEIKVAKKELAKQLDAISEEEQNLLIKIALGKNFEEIQKILSEHGIRI